VESLQTAVAPVAVPSEDQASAFLKLIETIGAAVLLHRGGHILYTNTALEGLTGFSRAELLAMDFYDLAHPASHDLVKQRGEARLRGEMVDRATSFGLPPKPARSAGSRCLLR
jgi:PAS domain S-box-containing protein